ncbi:MAG: hypothetical protein KatS3mg110_1906 [Pirellulaceae bacterium]|nr:MAG: hypothetical protein KatS3mg110_1906 [Pirellulaceae bacterium]
MKPFRKTFAREFGRTSLWELLQMVELGIRNFL